jgi:hypothetical protein
MSSVTAAPELITAAATDLANIRSAVTTAHAAAAAPITGVIAAAEDEVSAAIASLFSGHGEQFQALSTQAAAFHTQFVQALTSAGSSYAAAEAANASPLQAVAQGAQVLLTPNTVSHAAPSIRSPDCQQPQSVLDPQLHQGKYGFRGLIFERLTTTVTTTVTSLTTTGPMIRRYLLEQGAHRVQGITLHRLDHFDAH